MSIQDEIKVRQFRSAFHKAVVNVLYTSNQLTDSQADIFKAHGLLPQHFNVLRIVYGKHPEPISPGDILEVMMDKKRDLTRLVDKLVKLGLADRQLCPTNRRKVEVSITAAGIELVKKIDNRIYHWLEMHSSLSEEESETLSHLLDKLRAGL